MTTFDCSLTHYNHLKVLINNWLKTTMNQSKLDDYDIVTCGPREDQFEFTKWNYNFEKPSIDVVKVETKVNVKPPPLPMRKTQTINNLSGLS